MLSWIAATTSTIAVATRVLGVPYRNPAMVAKMAETLDRLSSGRLILGLGGGYSDEEFRAFGIRVPTPRDKVDGLEEAIHITRSLWTEDVSTYEGRLYHTAGAHLQPKPQRRIPIWLGTFGPRALALTGRLADGWIPSLSLAPPDQVKVMRDRVLAAAREAGRAPEEITCAYNVGVLIDEHARPDPRTVSGSPDAVIDKLLEFAGIGFTSFNFMPASADVNEQTERLAREVLPALRESVTG